MSNADPLLPSRPRLVKGALLYLVGKFFSILVTIFIGVFITVLLTNQPTKRGMGPPASPFETSLESQIFLVVRYNLNNSGFSFNNNLPQRQQEEALTNQLRKEYGLDLPYLPRNLLWTFKALTFDWGQLGKRQGANWMSIMNKSTASVTDVILKYLPKTLLLMGVSYLLLFLIGIPFSLNLALHHGNLLDRIVSFLSPISSIPSWVIAIILVAFFGLQLHWLPLGGIYDFNSPKDLVSSILMISKHMILPVTAIVLSLFFQFIFTWRTYFIIYSKEDYVDLGNAKGLPDNTLRTNYLFKPVMPYLLTSFITSFIGFWQLNMALEAVFRWPGLGWLYIKEALPNFWGETMEPGELIIVIAIVVIFAYLLGLTTFVLDLSYVLVDPRIHLLTGNKIPPTISNQKPSRHRLKTIFSNLIHRKRFKVKIPPSGDIPLTRFPSKQPMQRLKDFFTSSFISAKRFYLDLKKYPLSLFGFYSILMLVLGSILALTLLPYAQYGKDYERERLTGRSYRPRTASPIWINAFQKFPYLSTLSLDENNSNVITSQKPMFNGWTEEKITFTFDYTYDQAPSEMFLYFDPSFIDKAPFASFEWQYPDGTIIKLKDMTIQKNTEYNFESGIRISQVLNKNPSWKTWFQRSGQFPTAAFNLLFATPGYADLKLQRGIYKLTITSILFEKNSKVHPQLVLLGQVYGLAGTDYARRDLVVPLFWGMPFALLVGLFGTLITTLIAVLLPAVGVWYGGFFDNLIQRLTEINMVLPGLTIAVLLNVLFNYNIWIILGIVVIINTLGSPIKTIRAALLQAKENPYMESARIYGASNQRIITHYLIPRILPIVIPQLIMQIPNFIFWEATLGFFNIKTIYPSWGRIIFDGLSQGALYGSAFWVLEPIVLLLLTSIAFSMFGQGLEQILNPKMTDKICSYC